MTDIVVRHGYVITVDPQRRIFRDGAVAIDGDRITYVGQSADAPQSADRVIDASDMLVLPGFIDGHHHAGQYLSKGLGDDVLIFDWMYKRVYPYEAHLRPDDVYVGALGSFVEAIKTGTTCFNDPGGYHVERVAEAMRDVGIRGIITRSTRDFATEQTQPPPELMETTDEAVARGEALVQRWNHAENDRVRTWFSLRYPFNVSDDLAARIGELARAYQVGIHCHCAATKGENEIVEQQWGIRSVERYRRLGLLGPNLYLVHMGWVTEEEIEQLAEQDVKLVHCPTASMHGAYGNNTHGMIPRMVARGLTIGLGTDSATAGRFLDMVRVMYAAACVHKDVYADPQVMGAYKALEMATIDGARACLWDDAIGSLEPGKKADLVLVSTRGFQWQPMRDPLANLVYSANGESVDTVIIDGRLIMQGRRLLTVDEDQVRANVRRAADEVMGRAQIEVPRPWPVL